MHSEIANPGIVVGIDGSPDSGAALQWAVREATMRNVALTLVHAATPVPGDSLVLKWTGDSVPAELLGALGATAQQALADAVKLVEDMTDDRSRPRINNEAFSGRPVYALVELSTKADMVVVGSRGHGALERVLLGSVSTGLVHRAHCPVAVIRNEVSPQLRDACLSALMARRHRNWQPPSLSTRLPGGRRTRGSIRLDRRRGSRPLEPGVDRNDRTSWTKLQSEAEETLAERLAGWRERYPDVVVHREVVVNHPKQHLVELAESAQLVVVGSHGRGGFDGMLLGSVSTAVVHAVRTPVIVARGR